MRKQRDYEPLYLKIPLEVIRQHCIGYDEIPFSHQPTSITEVKELKEAIMALSAQVQTLVDQVTASTSVEAASAAALLQLVTQSKALSDQVAALMAEVAAGTSLSPADAAALTKAATDLHDSATALATAVPVGTVPNSPPTPIPPVVTP